MCTCTCCVSRSHIYTSIDQARAKLYFLSTITSNAKLPLTAAWAKFAVRVKVEFCEN